MKKYLIERITITNLPSLQQRGRIFFSIKKKNGKYTFEQTNDRSQATVIFQRSLDKILTSEEFIEMFGDKDGVYRTFFVRHITHFEIQHKQTGYSLPKAPQTVTDVSFFFEFMRDIQIRCNTPFHKPAMFGSKKEAIEYIDSYTSPIIRESIAIIPCLI